MEGYSCQTCGKYHEGPPLSYGSPAPALWFDIPEKDRKKRAVISSDQCEIDEKYFFVVGNIDIPILIRTDVFQWTVWVSLSKSNYDRIASLWHQKGRASEP